MRHPFEALSQICTTCKRELGLDAFPLDPTRKGGRAYVCRACKDVPDVVAPPAPTTKVCKTCKQELPLDAYSPAAREPGRWARCRSCENALTRAKRRRSAAQAPADAGRTCDNCGASPCWPTCLTRCPDCATGLDTHPQCARCEILVGPNHFEKRLVGRVCAGCAAEMPSGVSYRKGRPGRKGARA